MAGDYARVSYDPRRKWRGLTAQQGRVTVEADWNEAAAIVREHDRQLTLDVVGPVGTPDQGYAVTAVPAAGGTVVLDTHEIGPHGYRAIILDSEGNRIALHSHSPSAA